MTLGVLDYSPQLVSLIDLFLNLTMSPLTQLSAALACPSPVLLYPKFMVCLIPEGAT